MRINIFLILLFTSYLSYGSARVYVDHQNREVNISLKIFFYGNQAYRYPEVVAEIESQWPQRSLSVPKDYLWSDYKLNFQFEYEVLSDGQAYEQLKSNIFFEHNYIRLEEGLLEDESFVLSYGANCGVWYFSNGIGMSRTSAHEVGHLLGLPHPSKSFLESNDISLMCTRLTEVDPKYQYREEIRGTFGLPQLLDVRFRKLTDFDIRSLAELLIQRSGGGGQTNFSIGKVANFYFNEFGLPL